ncbi:MAG: TPM domain-containing protein [Rhodospirillaceae bacterium]|nr:TPM domain-containing protein [Rhodospirillaceae bacterium]MBT6404012.1 TPM domain-containing protein [Rhodospirillaceae bacterium]MBT7362268.1 TPM domain-containing protein [Rhodospirillaceae bacterium]
MFKRLRNIAAVAAFVFLGASAGLAQSSFPALSGLVVDSAGLLTPDDKERLTTILKQHETDTGGRVIVATIPNLGGRSIEAYGADLAHHWNIAKYPNSAILIVAEAERRVRMEFGPPVRGTMIDVRSSQMVQRVILPAFRAGQFDIGLETGLRELFVMLEEGVDQATDETRHLSELLIDKRLLLPVGVLALILVLCGRGRRPCGRLRAR